MTTGNAAATRRPTPAVSADRYVDATLELIAETGGSLDVNLRAVSRRLGCAHTNVYNYFDSYGDLLWAAFRRALRTYGGHLTAGLEVDMPAEAYLQRTIENLASFPQLNPGLYRFIGSDPIDLATIPPDILVTVTAMKRWFAATIAAAAGPRLDAEQARSVADMVLAYVDGETLNLINGRSIPDEDLGGRVVTNAMHIFDLTVTDRVGRRARRGNGPPPDPSSIFGRSPDG